MTLPPVVTYTTIDVAIMLHCSTDLVRAKVAAGVVTPLRSGSGKRAPLRFRPEDVETLMRAMQPPPEPARRARKRRL